MKPRTRPDWALSRPEEFFREFDTEALLALFPQATIFTTPAWISAACTALHGGRKPSMLACYGRDRLVALAPLTSGIELVDGVPLRTLRSAGYPFSDRMPLLVEGGRVELVPLLLDGLAHGRPGWDAILLNEVPSDPPVLDAIADWARATRHRVMFRLVSHSPVLRLDFADRAALLASYPRSLRTRLRRSRRKLLAAGRIDFRRLQPLPDQVPAVLADIRQVEDASWKGQARIGIFSHPRRRAFFAAVSERLAERGWLDIGLLSLDGRLIAYRYGFRFGDAWVDYNFAHRPDCNHLSPGRVLLDEMVLSSFDLGLKTVDASRGSLTSANILADWTDRAIDHVDVLVFNRTLPGLLIRIIETRLRPALRGLRRKPSARTTWLA